MPDMLVKLYNLKSEDELINSLVSEGIIIKRVFPLERRKVLDFVKENFKENYFYECEAALLNIPITCYIALKGEQIIGFACFESKTRDCFGPMGVIKSERGKGVGKALLNKALMAMYEMGYGYAIIEVDDDGEISFFEKAVNAVLIEI